MAVSTKRARMVSSLIAVSGWCDPAFGPVRQAFTNGFERGDEQGAAVAVVADGRVVVDLWAGCADQAGTVGWQQDTMVNIASATKGVLAIAFHQLVERGVIDLDAPVARYWPEFAEGGKGAVPVRCLLDHTAGLAAFGGKMAPDDVFDWERCTAVLATQEPLWDPGSEHGYHALTFGWLVGEVMRRAADGTPADLVGPALRALTGDEVRISLRGPEHRRVAEMGAFVADAGMMAALRRPGAGGGPSLPALVFGNPPLLLGNLVNSPAWRSGVVPAANGHATARGLARLYGALTGPERLLAPASVQRCSAAAVRGPDLVLGIETSFSLGFMLGIPHAGPGSFGHPGAGGSLGFCDPDAGFGFGYVMNRAEPTLHVGGRASRLLAALYDCPGPDETLSSGAAACHSAGQRVAVGAAQPVD